MALEVCHDSPRRPFTPMTCECPCPFCKYHARASRRGLSRFMLGRQSSSRRDRSPCLRRTPPSLNGGFCQLMYYVLGIGAFAQRTFLLLLCLGLLGGSRSSAARSRSSSATTDTRGNGRELRGAFLDQLQGESVSNMAHGHS